MKRQRKSVFECLSRGTPFGLSKGTPGTPFGFPKGIPISLPKRYFPFGFPKGTPLGLLKGIPFGFPNHVPFGLLKGTAPFGLQKCNLLRLGNQFFFSF